MRWFLYSLRRGEPPGTQTRVGSSECPQSGLLGTSSGEEAAGDLIRTTRGGNQQAMARFDFVKPESMLLGVMNTKKRGAETDTMKCDDLQRLAGYTGAWTGGPLLLALWGEVLTLIPIRNPISGLDAPGLCTTYVSTA